MLRYVLFDLSLFDDEDDRPSSQKRILWLLEALTCCDQYFLRRNPNTPLIYESGIKYKVPQQFNKNESPSAAVRDWLKKTNAPSAVKEALEKLSRMTDGERFRDIPRILENGGGDCDNVASWRAAELRERGIAARPYITNRKRPDGGTTYHVIVRYPDGSSEDPSLLLGMGGGLKHKERQEELRKLAERTADVLSGDLSTTYGPGATMISGIVYQGDPGFGKGLQYSIPFQTDDAYEDWSPTQPAQFWADVRYPRGLVQNTPYFPTRMRDPDDDVFDRFDGLGSVTRMRVRNALRRAA